MASNETFWTETIVIDGDTFARRVQTSSGEHDGSMAQLKPLFDLESAKGVARGRKAPNWSLDEALVPQDAFVGKRIIRLLPSELEEVTGEWFPVPSHENNRLFAFNVDGVRYVVDAVSLIQRFVAPQAQLFALLLCPFRDLVVQSTRVGDVIDMVVDTHALVRLNSSRTNFVDPAEASCLAYWTSSPDRLRELDRCLIAILRGTQLHVPDFPCSLVCSIRGIAISGTVYVQSLMPTSTEAGMYDFSWSDDASSVRICRPNGDVARELVFWPETEGWFKSVAADTRKTARLRWADGDVAASIRRNVGW